MIIHNDTPLAFPNVFPGLKTTFSIHAEDELPQGVTRHQVLAALHDHELMILRNSRVLSHRLLPPGDKNEYSDPTKEGKYTTYEVVDKMTFLPESLWPASSVTYTMAFLDTPTGSDLVLRAALGLVNRVAWSIKEQTDEEAEAVDRKEGGLILVEDCEVEVNRLVAGPVKKEMQATQGGNYKSFVEEMMKKYVESQ